MTGDATIGVVVLNWNGCTDTLACLESLLRAVPRPGRVVVVDNGSHDDSVARLTQWAEQHAPSFEVLGPRAPLPVCRRWLTIVASDTNRGFPGGNNAGLRFLEQDAVLRHFMLLNNDATVAEDFFAEIGRALETVPHAGLLTGTIREASDRTRVWYAGGTSLPRRALVEHRYLVPKSPEPVETEFISGCAMVISRRALEVLGPLAECYFPLYFEDAEYCYRARAAGLTLLYVPRAAAFHKIGATVGMPWMSPGTARTMHRHRVLYVRRNFAGLTRIMALLYLAATKPGRATLEVLRRQPRYGWAILTGTLAGFVARSGGAQQARPTGTGRIGRPSPTS